MRFIYSERLRINRAQSRTARLVPKGVREITLKIATGYWPVTEGGGSGGGGVGFSFLWAIPNG